MLSKKSQKYTKHVLERQRKGAAMRHDYKRVHFSKFKAIQRVKDEIHLNNKQIKSFWSAKNQREFKKRIAQCEYHMHCV